MNYMKKQNHFTKNGPENSMSGFSVRNPVWVVKMPKKWPVLPVKLFSKKGKKGVDYKEDSTHLKYTAFPQKNWATV